MSQVSLDQQQRWMAAQARPEDMILRRFRHAHRHAALAALAPRVFGGRAALLTLAELLGGRALRGSRSAGLCSVPIAAVVASEGRIGDFDARFRPLRLDSWDRWRSVALAVVRGDALPPVELLAVGGCYAVRDGHHRISVAAAMGQREVDALVTVLEV
jgi:hypothetical protein